MQQPQTNTNQPNQPHNGKNPNVKWMFIAGGCGCLLLVIPIMAAIAIPAFISYVKRSKVIEATSELRVLSERVVAECQMGEDLSGLRAGPLPATPGSIQSSPAWQLDPGFARLGYAPSMPVRYSYAIEPSAADPTQLTLRALGDLDDDGIFSTFTIPCDLRTCACAPNIQVADELE